MSSHQNNSLLPYSFDNYYWGNDSSINEEIIKLFENDFQFVDCIIINSEVGMGGTHLLYAIFKKCKEQIFYNGEYFINLFGGQRDKLEMLMSNKYIFIDDFHVLFNKEKLNNNLFDFFKEFIKRGGKLFIKCNNIFHSNLKELFCTCSNIVFDLKYNRDIASQIIDTIYTELNKTIGAIVHLHVITEAIKDCSFKNYREIGNYIICIIAKKIKTKEEMISLHRYIFNK